MTTLMPELGRSSTLTLTPSRPTPTCDRMTPPHPPSACHDGPARTQSLPCQLREECDGQSPQPSKLEEGLCEPSSRSPHPSPWQPWRRRDGWTGWMRESIATPNFVPALVMQAFSAGVLDATTYADFHTFASNQTGNTILLTVAVFDAGEILLLLTGVSLASFLLGALVFGHLGHFMGIRRRAWVLVSTAWQIIVLIVAAILVSPLGPAVTQIGARHEWLPLVLFAHMSGAQVAMARQSGSQELPTAPMTSSYVDLMADKYLFRSFWHPKAGPRNRRLAYLLAMITGGFVGACVHKYVGNWAVIVVTIGLKAIVFGQLCFAGAEA